MVLSINESLSINLSNSSNFQRVEKQPLIPFRYFVIFLLFSGSAISFAIRCVINFALLAMVPDARLPRHSNETVTLDEIKFNWDQRDQGLVLGAYFYTYASSQIISGILTDKFNAVHLLTASQLIAACCSFLCPIAAEYGIFYLIGARMVIGLAHGLLFPSCYILMERWLSTTEISFAQSCVSVGSNFGVVIVMPLTAWLCDNGFAGGWPSSFYVIATTNVIFVLIWTVAMTLDPSANRWTSEAEKRFIEKTNSSKKAKNKIAKTPWVSLLTSLPLWTVMLTRGINGLVYYTINTKIPEYMDKILGYQLQGNGLINSLFYVAICSSQLISGPASRWIINRNWLSKNVTRKIFESIALLGSGLCLVLITILGDRSDLIIVVLVSAMFFNGFTVGGDIPIVPEMAPHLVGTAFGFSNTLGCAAGFTAPVVAAAILGNDVYSKDRWNKTFYTFAFVQVIGTLSFISFATAEPQCWGVVTNQELAVKREEKTESGDLDTQPKA